MIKIEAIKAFQDNYIWALQNTDLKTVWIVDPGDAKPVLEFLKIHHLHLSGILITHHHADHCGGVDTLLKHFKIPVYGPHHPQILATHIVKEGDTIFLPDCNLNLTILAIPGHTLEHIAFYCEKEALLFCGDTLFSAGCGRIFEGTPEQMLTSLQCLANLPDETQIYCAHEYTMANLRFAQTVEPDNPAILAYQEKVLQKLKKNETSLPSSLLLEKNVNPFLRITKATIIKSAEKETQNDLKTPLSVFKAIREWKNHFK